MKLKNELHSLMIKLILMSIILSFIPVGLMHFFDHSEFIVGYTVILLYTLVLTTIGFHYYFKFTERTARELKALVKKESMINGELILINTEEKLKNVMSLEIERVSKTVAKSTMLFFDVDDLGKFNENYGYDVGDQIIIELILTTRGLLGERDQLARVKGDTFAIMFPDTDANKVYDFASRLKQEIDQMKFDVPEKVSCRFVIVTIDRWVTEDKLLNLAYEKLKHAKDYGKGVIL